MGRNNADFNGVTYTHKADKLSALIQAIHPENGTVGHMLLGFERKNRGRNVRNIMVNPEHQRQGIATGMWNYAKEQGLNPEHSDPTSQTDEGKSWAKKVGN
jgi:GNAT superfamily N-acetyltransferase